MPTLYRKYRPQKFSDLVEQKHLVKTLQNEISGDKIAHAYLFSGPRGIGKTTLARIFAKAINCPNRKEGEFEPCDNCSSCTEITASRNIDVLEMDAASHTGVDNVRENIIENAQFKPTKSKYKIFIIDEVHMLSTSAFNALLKTLEEPPAHAVFILATTEPQKIPATIISRCQRFNFKKINLDSVVERLEKIAEQEKIKVDKKVLRQVAAKSDGCLRDAESLLGQIFSLGKNKITQEDAQSILPSGDIQTVVAFADFILQKNQVGALQIIDDLVQNGKSLSQFHEDLLQFWRLLIILKNKIKTSALYELNSDIIKQMDEIIKKVSDQELLNLADLTIKRMVFAKNCPIAQLPLELLVIESLAEKQVEETKDKNYSPLSKKLVLKDGVLPSEKEPEQKKEILPKTEEIKEDEKIKKEITNKRLISFEEINEKWPEVLNKINEKSPSLLFVLKMANLIEINENILTLVLPYDFHQKKIKDNKNNELLQGIFMEVFGENLQLQCTVAEKPFNTEINDLAADFGGQVV